MIARFSINRDGFWLWLWRLGILFRNHERHPALYSERYGPRVWACRVGPMRLTVRWRPTARLPK